uniref:Uncharacterized protein n=1 Tax=Romanomermis culicivorax TaxID=13658 RepID=A0A915K2S6_ROMCU
MFKGGNGVFPLKHVELSKCYLRPSFNIDYTSLTIFVDYNISIGHLFQSLQIQIYQVWAINDQQRESFPYASQSATDTYARKESDTNDKIRIKNKILLSRLGKFIFSKSLEAMNKANFRRRLMVADQTSQKVSCDANSSRIAITRSTHN